MFSFPYDLTISSRLTIRLDVEVEVDPPEDETHDCPGSVGGIDQINVFHDGLKCNADLAECVMDDICKIAAQKMEEVGDES